MKKINPLPEKRIPFTSEGYEKLKITLETLRQSRPDAVEHLRKAREMGDLSENGYYRASRSRLSFLDSQIRKTERLLRLGIVASLPNDNTIGIGSSVTISDGSNNYEYVIVGSFESNPTQKSISHVSPLGKALMGKTISDTIKFFTPSGTKSYTILTVR